MSMIKYVLRKYLTFSNKEPEFATCEAAYYLVKLILELAKRFFNRFQHILMAIKRYHIPGYIYFFILVFS